MQWTTTLDPEMKRQLSLNDRGSSLYRCKWCSVLFDSKLEADKHATECSIGIEKV